MKILFLDIDGVLNSCQDSVFFRRSGGDYGKKFSPLACSNVQFLLDSEPLLRIVISSSWCIPHKLEELKSILTTNGIDVEKVIGITPIDGYELLESQSRGSQIKGWLTSQLLKTDFVVTDYVILDDDSDMLTEQEPYFVKTSIMNGFIFSEALQAARILNINGLKPVMSYYW
jgi:hypothetical protein